MNGLDTGSPDSKVSGDGERIPIHPLVIFLVVVSIATVFLFAGLFAGQNCERGKAIQADVGRWTIDRAGNTEFKYGCEHRTR